MLRARAAPRRAGHAARELPQLLLPAPALAVHRPAAREGHLMAVERGLRAGRARRRRGRHRVPRRRAAPGSRSARRRSRRAGSTTTRDRELFEEITELPEYYPTRAETEILATPRRRVRRADRAGPGGGRVRLGQHRQDAAPAARDRACRLRADRHLGRFPARSRRRRWRPSFPVCRSIRSRPISRSRSRLPDAGARTCPSSASFPARPSATWCRATRGRPAALDARDAGRGRAAADRDGPDQGRGDAASRPMTMPRA